MMKRKELNVLKMLFSELSLIPSTSFCFILKGESLSQTERSDKVLCYQNDKTAAKTQLM